MARIDWTDRQIWLEPGAWSYLFLSFEGRIPRLPFWGGAVVLNVFAYIGDRLAMDFGGHPAAAVVGLAFLYPSLALSIKRAHDRGHSDLYLLFFFLPAFLVSFLQVLGYMDSQGPMGPVLFILGLWVLAALIALVIDLGLMRGEEGSNRYGPDPLQ
ncbi:MAG: DUF805 domain-containing protein [Phreatobacter sp.]|uniref:DUF805 domain-containing protein n=1 Tax=Phreatobacter sp. TaxID=1966341 RepID=UPI001A447D5D|nr:DUF805 domain-containing protein [Phreatobacter sp.]MBL8570760.1 DUF805 domain-containing protein [Phreatobacter sp.]